ncbi:MAG: hypothetical protein Ta2B_03360 [Termitinemataceae bacterium]|nr:MAG: hypothetical protein Ta2B_03360 [Termitinemataceae bacterium]
MSAYKLITEIPEVTVHVFEATERAGGISATIAYKGNRIDIGGQRFFSKSKLVNDFWQEMMSLSGM